MYLATQVYGATLSPKQVTHKTLRLYNGLVSCSAQKYTQIFFHGILEKKHRHSLTAVTNQRKRSQ